MSIDYKVNQSIESLVDRHVDRIERLKEHLEDVNACQYLHDSLVVIKGYEEEHGGTQFTELMRDLDVQKIYKNIQQKNRGSSNTDSGTGQGTQRRNSKSRKTSSSEGNRTTTQRGGNELPKTQLILTVGTNPLPVWIAWKHLVDLKVLENQLKVPTPIQVRLVHTAGTAPQKDILQSKCGSLPEYPRDVSTSDTVTRDIQTSPGDPQQIRTDIQRYVFGTDGKSLPDNIQHIHVHYTGGTQAMGVETVAAIESEIASNKKVQFSASYLNARDDSGIPKIVSRPNGQLVPDTRSEISLDLSIIATLNGIILGPHTYTNRHSQTIKLEPPIENFN